MDNPLFKTYMPKGFCRGFIEIKRDSLQLGMYMALALGYKPLMDDWVPVEKLAEFKKVCHELRIYTREDVVFENINKNDIPEDIIGRQNLTTTSAYGSPLEANTNGSVHIFLSKDKAMLKKSMWYPVIISGRVIFQPRIDSLKFGYALGYPDCCIKFFRKYNEWTKYSYLYEAYRNTKNKPIYCCNPFLKDTNYSYIYHMPCAYDCENTISLVNNLRREISKREPDYVKLTDTYLKMPFLVFYEKKFYIFEGRLKGNSLKYKKVYFCTQDESKDTYGKDLKKADSLELQGRRIVLYRGNNIAKILDIPITDFAPEYPFLIQFNS